MSTAPDPADRTVAELLAAVRTLSDRVEHLEAELVEARAGAPVPEEVVLAISAAVAAYLGCRVRVRRVHYRTGAAWAQQGRAVVQGRHDVSPSWR